MQKVPFDNFFFFLFSCLYFTLGILCEYILKAEIIF